MSQTLIQPGIIEVKRLGFDVDNTFKALIAIRMDHSGNLLQFEIPEDELHKVTELLTVIRCQFWEDLTNQSVLVKRQNDKFYLGHPSQTTWMELKKR